METERLKSIKDCITLDEFVENIFPFRNDEFSSSNPFKRELLKRWVFDFTNNQLSESYKSRTPKEMAEDIYKPNWDDKTQLFQQLREYIIKWIEDYKKINEKLIK